MAIELNVKIKELTWLGKAFEDKTIISPFLLFQDSDFNEENISELIEKGIIDEENNLKAEFYPLLECLSKADKYVEIKFKRGPVEARKYILSAGENSLSAAYKDDMAYFIMPSNPQAMAEYLKDFMGGSKLSGCDVSLEADACEVFVFTAVCDLYRKDVFRAYAEEEVFVYRGASKDNLLEAMNNLRENSQKLAYHIFVLNKGFEIIDEAKLEEAINSLAEKGLIKEEDNKYYPAGEGLLFAGNFLIIENMLELVAGQLHEDKLYRSSFAMLQAGPLDLVYMEKSGDKIIMECMSALNAVNFVEDLMSKNYLIV